MILKKIVMKRLKFKLVQNNNKLFLKEITKNFGGVKKEKEIEDKAKSYF